MQRTFFQPVSFFQQFKAEIDKNQHLHRQKPASTFWQTDNTIIGASSLLQMTRKGEIGWSKLVPYLEIVKGNVL